MSMVDEELNVIESVYAGDRVRWECRAGTIRGEVKEIRLMINLERKLVPWLIIEYIRDNEKTLACICGNEDNLKMLKFQVNFRDRFAEVL